jgi:hypothetical protein
MAKHNKTGRSKFPGGSFIQTPHYLFDCFAWTQLSVTARCAWHEVVRKFNGSNNGRLAVSTRDLGERLRVSKDTAGRALKELVTYGFLAIMKQSSFNIKRLATEYRLTHLKCDVTGELSTKEFMRIGAPVIRIGASQGHHRRMGEPMN